MNIKYRKFICLNRSNSVDLSPIPINNACITIILLVDNFKAYSGSIFVYLLVNDIIIAITKTT